MRVYTAPELPTIGRDDKSIFLAGSIEMDTAREWQNEMIEKLAFLGGQWVVLNPRRKEWDSSWEQRMSNPYFFQQVMWEMSGLNRANYNVFFFANDTMSPITLLELGKYGRYNSMVVCEEKYKRRGNVEIFCHENEIPIYNTMEEVIVEFLKISHE